jgi:hypothetical protein
MPWCCGQAAIFLSRPEMHFNCGDADFELEALVDLMLFELAELGVDAVEFTDQLIDTSVKARLDRGEFVRGWEWQALLLQGAFMWQAMGSARGPRSPSKPSDRRERLARPS